MCLQIFIQIPTEVKLRVGAKQASLLSGFVVTKTKFKGVSALHFSVTGGCSCEFLSTQAKFDSEKWTLKQAHLPNLTRIVEIIGKKSKKMSFLAYSLGGSRELIEKPIKLKELLKLIRNNEIGNNVLYVVGRV